MVCKCCLNSSTSLLCYFRLKALFFLCKTCLFNCYKLCTCQSLILERNIQFVELSNFVLLVRNDFHTRFDFNENLKDF